MFDDNDFGAAASRDLVEVVADAKFPCLGAKSAMARGMLRTLVCETLDSSCNDTRIHSELVTWVADYRSNPASLRSLAIIFEGPRELDEVQFEAAMWRRLQALAILDARRGQPYDSSVSSDPDDPNFSLSFGGAAFFVIGLHPHASRPARRMPRPTLVFNLHDQFERLREEGRYERMRERILDRDAALAALLHEAPEGQRSPFPA